MAFANRQEALEEYVLMVNGQVVAQRLGQLLDQLGPAARQVAFTTLKDDYKAAYNTNIDEDTANRDAIDTVSADG